MLPYSHFANFFTHYGFERTISTKKPEELLVALDGKIMLELHWFGARGLPSEGVSAICSSALIDSGFATKIDQGILGTP